MQQLKFKYKILIATTIIAVIFFLIYLIKSILTPFIFSLIIAYFLNPLVDYLHRKKLSRLKATALILGLFLTIITTICLIFLPIIFGQLADLISALPEYFITFTTEFYPKIASEFKHFGFNIGDDFTNIIQDQKITDQVVDLSQNIFGNALDSSLTIINILSLIFITPILVFYLLKDWDLLIKTISDYLPRNLVSSTKKIAGEIDKTLSGYVRGQFNVCLTLALFYSCALSLTGLNFGFLIGFLTGIFAFIPYVGMLCGTTIAIVIALFQWGFDGTYVTLITLIFVAGNILESNFLTPKLIGKKIGLHPVWIIFGLFAFGALFGFTGILVAVPLTAICGTIIRHFALEYKKRFT